MAQIDKIQVQSTTYDVAQSSAASFTGTSNDTASPSAWTDVNVLGNTETNGSIFTKISKMFANIRWLYKQLGTTDYSATGGSTVSAALAALQSGKAATSHSHGVSDLPVTDQQNNSSSTIPTSALIYSMNQTLTSLNDAISNINMLVPNKTKVLELNENYYLDRDGYLFLYMPAHSATGGSGSINVKEINGWMYWSAHQHAVVEKSVSFYIKSGITIVLYYNTAAGGNAAFRYVK